MKRIVSFTTVLLAAAVFFTACNEQKENNEPEQNSDKKMTKPVIKEEMVAYSLDSVTMNGFVAYDESTDKKRPVIMIVHEWWGLNDYTKGRARQLAELGYLAFAVDMYGKGATADNPELAGKMAGPFYKDPVMAKARFDAGLTKAKSYSVADAGKVAAIGYCFGGSMVINAAKLGDALNGVVSFHGGLAGVVPDKMLLKAPMLICHGADDKFVSEAEIANFKKEMDSVKAEYTFKTYPGATHAFTNPNATAVGEKFKIPIAYNAAADTASWKDMNDFFGTIFK